MLQINRYFFNEYKGNELSNLDFSKYMSDLFSEFETEQNYNLFNRDLLIFIFKSAFDECVKNNLSVYKLGEMVSQATYLICKFVRLTNTKEGRSPTLQDALKSNNFVIWQRKNLEDIFKYGMNSHHWFKCEISELEEICHEYFSMKWLSSHYIEWVIFDALHSKRAMDEFESYKRSIVGSELLRDTHMDVYLKNRGILDQIRLTAFLRKFYFWIISIFMPIVFMMISHIINSDGIYFFGVISLIFVLCALTIRIIYAFSKMLFFKNEPLIFIADIMVFHNDLDGSILNPSYIKERMKIISSKNHYRSVFSSSMWSLIDLSISKNPFVWNKISI